MAVKQSMDASAALTAVLDLFSGLGDQGNLPTIHLRHHKFLVFAFQLQEFLPQPCHLLPRLQVGRRAVGSRGNRGVDAKKNSGWASLGGFKGRPVWNSRSCHTGCSWRVAMKDMKRIRKLHPPWSFDLLSAESQSPKTPLRARSFTESVVFVPCHIYYMTWLHCRHQFHPYNQKWHFFSPHAWSL